MYQFILSIIHDNSCVFKSLHLHFPKIICNLSWIKILSNPAFIFVQMSWLEERRSMLYFLIWIQFTMAEIGGPGKHEFSGSHPWMHISFTQKILKILIVKRHPRPIRWGPSEVPGKEIWVHGRLPSLQP